jgi:16S rRNA (cytidine1402-2'-O)-methyltransferase
MSNSNHPIFDEQDPLLKNIFRKNVVFGSLPIGNPADISLNMIHHIMKADILLVENHRIFSKLLTNINESMISAGIDFNTHADIYQYDLHSRYNKMDDINNLVIKNAHNKNILIVSDEGSSIFLEPAVMLKIELVRNGIEFVALPGPNAVISTIISSQKGVTDFYFGNIVSAIKPEFQQREFEKVKQLNIPAVYLLHANGAKRDILALQQGFGDDSIIEYCMNLTMPTEEYVRGTFNDVLNFIESNPERYIRDSDHNKYSIIIYPPHIDYSRYITFDFEIEGNIGNGRR